MQQENQKISTYQNLNKNRFVNLLFVNAELKQTTFKKTIALYMIMAIVFFSFAIAMFVVLDKVKEYQVTYYDPLYDTQCSKQSQQACNITLTINQDLDGEVYLMYQVGNFYQNHRRYLQSKSNYQLAGNQLDDEDAVVCDPYITNKDMGKTKSWGNFDLDPQAIASPCGAIAKTFFNDTYQLFQEDGQQVFINQTGISWPGDKGYKYKNGPNNEQVQWINQQDQHFIVWMRTSGLPNFRKLWGRIQGGLSAGNYRLQIQKNYNSKDWQGSRQIILTTNTIFGGKNLVMPICFLILGVGCLIAGIFFIKKWKSDKNHLD